MTSPAGSVAAIDLGATSGRVIIGAVGPNTLTLQQIARFPNEPVRTRDGLYWDILSLYAAVLHGLRDAYHAEPDICSIGIDSWGVDYGLMYGGRLLGNPFHYRDARTADGVTRVHEQMPYPALFQRNGLQFLPFNTLYQLAAERCQLLDIADSLLFIPDLIGYWLTGVARAERTIASTTGILHSASGAWDAELLAVLGIPSKLFRPLIEPGQKLGPLSRDVADSIGTSQRVAVTTVASHDTASAVVAAPLREGAAAFISCGTWGLVGIESQHAIGSPGALAARFINEVGVDGRVLFLRNVMGLWILTEAVRSWGPGRADELERLLVAASSIPSRIAVVFDVDDPRFLPPGDMAARIDSWCDERGIARPSSKAHYVRSILESLAQAFADAAHEAARLGGIDLRVINLVGGGARNELLCQSIANRTELPVAAGPVEATATGNILIQARAMELLTGSLETMRDLVERTQVVRWYEPLTSTTLEG